jgi:uncharacterized protein YqjF (DUF2071 family)
MNTKTNSDVARDRFLDRERKSLFLGSWVRALFIHFEVDPAILQPRVPYELDVRDGKAYVSLVAFTMERLRPAFGGWCTEQLAKPIATHHFLNVRTYVKHNGEPGIYFMHEWLSSWLAVQLGPPLYGLPYHFARMHYEAVGDEVKGAVRADGDQFQFAAINNGQPFRPCAADSLSEFLLERYTAYTGTGSSSRLFRIWHEPWPQVAMDVNILDDSLLQQSGDWYQHAKLMQANYSIGARDIWIGRPRRCAAPNDCYCTSGNISPFNFSK